MAKNAPNELKFLPDMYFYEFYQSLFKVAKMAIFSHF